jgi:hypothetical protein
MQRQIIHGVPYFTDAANNLYLWSTEQSATCIGSYDPATQAITFQQDHLTTIKDQLTAWRSSQTIRARKSTNGRGTGGQTDGAQPTEHSHSDT